MRIAIPVVAGCILIATALPVRSETLSVRPSVQVTERWDSNVLNAPHGSESEDTVTRVTPNLIGTLSIFSTNVSLVGGFDAEYFARHSELNRTSMTKNVDLSSADPLKITPTFTLRPTARFIESRDAVRRNQLSQSTVPGLAPAETQVTARTGTRTYSGSLNANYAASPNLDFGMGVGATRNSYFDGGSSLVGSKNYSANLSTGYRVTANLSTGIYGTASYDDFDNNNDVRNFSGGLSWTYLFSPSSTLDARGGMTSISDDLGKRFLKPSGRLDYSLNVQNFSVAVGASIDYAAGGYGTETKRENVSLRLSDRFSENWSGDTAGVWQTNRSLSAPYLEDQMSVQWSAGVHYSVTEYARLNLSGELFRQWNRGAIGTDLYRQSAMLGFEIGSDFPLF